MNLHLVVVRSFGKYAKGDIITDSTAINEILAGENAHYVVRVVERTSSHSLAVISAPATRQWCGGENGKPPPEAKNHQMSPRVSGWPKPSWKTIWLHCSACGFAWDDWQPIMVPVETWIAHCKTYHCPNCGRTGRNVCPRTKPLHIA